MGACWSPRNTHVSRVCMSSLAGDQTVILGVRGPAPWHDERGWPLETRPSPHVLPYRIWSLLVKLCLNECTYRRTFPPEIWDYNWEFSKFIRITGPLPVIIYYYNVALYGKTIERWMVLPDGGISLTLCTRLDTIPQRHVQTERTGITLLRSAC